MVKMMCFTGYSFPLHGKNWCYLQGTTSNGQTVLRARMMRLAELLLHNFRHVQRNFDVFQIIL